MATVLSSSGSVPGKPGARVAISDLGDVQGTVGGGGLELNVLKRLSDLLDEKSTGQQGGFVETFQLRKEAKGHAGTPLNSLCGGGVTLSFEVIQPMPHILICGGGHCGEAIADTCELLDWKFSVFDVREEYANVDSYPCASDHLFTTAEEFIASESSATLARFSDLLLVGHDWGVDETLLRGLLALRQADPTSWRTKIGVIGSKAKWKSFSEVALEDGIKQEYLDDVTCPIGLNIGAESPSEIAIAVTAQILARLKSQDPYEPNWRQPPTGHPNER